MEYLILIVGLIGYIIYKIITKYLLQNEKKDIDFNDFDDLNSIKQTQVDEAQLNNEYKKMERFLIDKYTDSNNHVDYQKVQQELNGVKRLDAIKSRKSIKKQEIYEAVQEEEILSNDKSFNTDLFKKWAREIFKYVQLGSIQEISEIKEFISEELLDRKIFQMNEFKKDGLELKRDNLLIEEFKLQDYSRGMGRETIQIFVKVKVTEFIQKIATQEVVRGNANKPMQKGYLLTFQKKESKAQDVFIHNCPNCGAEVGQTEFGRCKYCNSFIIPIRYNWQLIKFENI